MNDTIKITPEQNCRRVLVLGASGHLGGRILKACETYDGLLVCGASRHSDRRMVHVDLNDARTFDSLQDFHVVINATDSAKANPLQIAQYCLERGKIFMETSAETDVFKDLVRLNSDLPGTIVLGAGAFPGLSTHLLELAPADKSVEFRAAWSVLSGSGSGTVDVMVNALAAPAVTFQNGTYKNSPTLTPIQRRKICDRDRVVMPLSMADVVLAAETGFHPNVSFLAAVEPDLPVPVLKTIAALAGRGVFSLPPIRWALRLWLRLLRQHLFGRKKSAIRIELHTDDGMIAALECDDAFGAGADAVAILAATWPFDVTGLNLPHQGVPLREMARQLGNRVKFEIEDQKRLVKQAV